jgi:uncharacterized protein (DUF488 family)
MRAKRPIFAIGHSNRSLEELVDVLRAHEIAVLVDIRTIRRSRANPQFDEDVLGPALARVGVRYQALAALGGLRHARAGDRPSPNAGWQNASFRSYADYAMTAPFREGLRELLWIAARARTAIMCAEVLWWRCHRRIVADHLLARGVPVVHLFTRRHAERARMTRFAVVARRGVVTYPAAEVTSSRAGRVRAPRTFARAPSAITPRAREAR